ncbi:FUSC family membrane protein [Chitinivorax sp. PXF-14]|uniref:FUSC family membrane protein n=1 Tax=Chitinivorax sp. PXF-14 TaxID=3230488 RepID=UPI0034672333
MHYALNPRVFIFSHYFHTGLRVATGVIGLTALVFRYTDLPTAMTVCIGALCTSQMDLPSPIRHKFNEMLASVLLCTLVTLLISLSSPYRALLYPLLVLVSFLASMMVVYGKKSLPLQFAALFVMTLSMVNVLSPMQALGHSALFCAGGLAYLGYAMAVSWCLRFRTKQQILAEALFELGRYIELKAACYDPRIDLKQQFTLLVRQQVILADKQQASRDLLLRGVPDERDRRRVQVHFGMLDLYELVLSTHADYALLRRHAEGAPALTLMRSLVEKAAQDIEAIAYDVTRQRASAPRVNYTAELAALDRELTQWAQSSGPDGKAALVVLRTAANKLREVIEMIERLHRATAAVTGPPPTLPGADMTPFLTQQRYEIGLMLSHLRRDSPIFRFSLRVAMAVAVGLAVASTLPYMAHGYWILLTIVIVLKPSFSMTKRRRGDRLIGTAIGCALTAVILHLVHAPAVLLALLYLTTAAAPAFLQIKYRYTAIAASMQILLQTSLLLPAGSHVIGERLIDTAIGTAIATIFSFVLPSWEYRALPQLVRKVLEANRRYLDASSELLRGRMGNDLAYRLCRKRFMDDLANLGAALSRMLDEPEDKQRAADELNQFIVQNYLVVTHVAALRLLLRRHAAELTPQHLDGPLQQTFAAVSATLEQARQALAAVPATPPSTPTPPEPATDPGIWGGEALLSRRLALLHSDAAALAASSAVLGRKLGAAPAA